MDFDMMTVGWIVAGGFAFASHYLYMKIKFNQIERSAENFRRDTNDMIRAMNEHIDHEVNYIRGDMKSLMLDKRNCCKETDKSYYNSNA